MGKYKRENVKVYYIDGLCFHDMFEKLGISHLKFPYFFAYYQTKNEYYSQVPLTWDYETLDNFIGKA